MSDFCKQCSEVLFEEDVQDLAGFTNEDHTEQGLFASVICEGCGVTQVDHTGRCIHHEDKEAGCMVARER